MTCNSTFFFKSSEKTIIFVDKFKRLNTLQTTLSINVVIKV